MATTPTAPLQGGHDPEAPVTPKRGGAMNLRHHDDQGEASVTTGHMPADAPRPIEVPPPPDAPPPFDAPPFTPAGSEPATATETPPTIPVRPRRRTATAFTARRTGPMTGGADDLARMTSRASGLITSHITPALPPSTVETASNLR